MINDEETNNGADIREEVGVRVACVSPLERKVAIRIQGKQRQNVVEGVSRAELSCVP